MTRKSIVSSLLILLSIFTSCKTTPPDPIIKETFEGEIKKLQIDIHSGSTDYIFFDIVDDLDGKTYSFGMDRMKASDSNFNGFSYIDSTNLITAETQIVIDTTQFNDPNYISLSPIQDTLNQIHVQYTEGQMDKTFKTRQIKARISNKTILTVGDIPTNAKTYKTEQGIKKYLRPYLSKCIKVGFSNDVDSIQPGAQQGNFYVYQIKQRE